MEYQNFIKSSCAENKNVPKILRQYLDIKRQNTDSIVFFRLGDFYETYFEDAHLLSKVCGVLLTKRKFTGLGDVSMAGVPHYNAEIYISKLVNEKYKVSIVEQVGTKEDVKRGEILKREVIRTYSPGTLIEENFLDSKKNNYIAAVLKNSSSLKPNDRYGFSYADISTGDFFITEGNLDEILCELSKIEPSEVLLKIKTREIEPMKAVPDEEADIDECISKACPYTLVNKDFFSLEFQNDSLIEYELGLKCANAIINYTKETQKNFMPKLDVVRKYSISSKLIMNLRTRENLELNRNSHDGKKFGSILWAVDECKTPMGKRLLASFLNEPLYNLKEIEKRLDGVEELISNEKAANALRAMLEDLADISRLSSKLSNATIAPKELIAIKNTLSVVEEFGSCCAGFKSEILKTPDTNEILVDFRGIIDRTIKEDPSNNIRVGNIIKDGANGTVDALRAEIAQLEGQISAYEKEIAEKTGVKNLKITYSKNLGYSIDVPVSGVNGFVNSGIDFTRKQKLTSLEKFGTARLSELEERLLSLRLKLYEVEYDTFLKLREYAKEVVEPLREFSHEIALKDVLASFAHTARVCGFVRPRFSKNFEYKVKNGLHPVLMRLLTSENKSCDSMDADFSESEKIKILTGANMSGKSTYLRELGSLVILAQSGSYVPAEGFRANLVDKIYARMGSFDDMLNSSSAFMCEMLDVAEILRNATSKSLILLDETGKSTSYSDGISLSYGIIKYISKEIKAKTVLATHFSDLNVLEKENTEVQNYRLVMEKKEGISKRSLEKGVCTSSMGLNVGIEAKLPPYVIECAKNFVVNK